MVAGHRQGQNRRIRQATRDALPDLRDTRIFSEGQWPRLGVELAVARTVRYARPDVHWSPAEAPAVIVWHREAAALETAKQQLMTPVGGSKSELPSDDDDNLQKQIRAAVKQALQAKQQGQEINSAEAKRRRGELRLGTLAQLILATVLDSSHDIKVGGLCLCIDVLFFQGNRVYEICQR